MTPKTKTETGARPDAAIAWDIRQALKLDHEVPDERIMVRVEHGMVTLDGTVEALLQREAAEADAHKVRGVRGVTNRIHV